MKTQLNAPRREALEVRDDRSNHDGLLSSKSKRRDSSSKDHAARKEVIEIMHRHEEEPDHVLHVARLALQLFSELAHWHQLGERERQLLEAASCLHDVGWSVDRDGRRHHKLSARIIREQTWREFDQVEVELIALIARYHRKSLPRPGHRAFGALSKPHRRLVRTLAALLRVADALDRRHLQLVDRVRVQNSDSALVFHLHASRSLAHEIAAADRKGDLLRKLTKRELLFQWTGA